MCILLTMVSWHIYVCELPHGGLRRIMVKSSYFSFFSCCWVIPELQTTPETQNLLNLWVFWSIRVGIEWKTVTWGAHFPPNFAPEHQRTVKLQFPEFFDKKWYYRRASFLIFTFLVKIFNQVKILTGGWKFLTAWIWHRAAAGRGCGVRGPMPGDPVGAETDPVGGKITKSAQLPLEIRKFHF